jgi:hypothetical protein
MPDVKQASPSACRASKPPGAQRPGTLATALLLATVIAGCTETYDAGASRPHGPLPVDERNPVLLFNDSQYDNWEGEYAVLLASSGGLSLDGIVVNTSPNATNIDDNLAGWRNLIAAARNSGMRGLPDPIKSTGAPLVRPASGDIDVTVGNGSAGAQLIVSESSRKSLPYRPLAVVTAGRLTDVADAYLLDPTVVDRVVVVSTLGTLTATGAAMGVPNGEMDPWADTIVTSRFRFVAVSAHYDQTADVPASRLSELPDNAFGTWLASRQSQIWNDQLAADQVAVAAVALSTSFVVAVERVSPGGPIAAGATAGPTLTDDPNGPLWLVRQIAASVAIARFWEILLDPKTYGP